MSAHQLHRMLGVTYKSAWFMAHRIRYAMKQELSAPKLEGTVEIDETYVGGMPRGVYGKRGRPGKDSKKVPVVALVQRKGDVRSFHTPDVTGANLKQVIHENVDISANVITDEYNVYMAVLKDFASHDVIRHKDGFFVKRNGDKKISTNTVEGYFSLLKRGIIGVYHHVSRQHLHRYLSEFDFRYNARQINDSERTLRAIKKTAGKRLKYRDASPKTKF